MEFVLKRREQFLYEAKDVLGFEKAVIDSNSHNMKRKKLCKREGVGVRAGLYLHRNTSISAIYHLLLYLQTISHRFPHN